MISLSCKYSSLLGILNKINFSAHCPKRTHVLEKVAFSKTFRRCFSGKRFISSSSLLKTFDMNAEKDEESFNKIRNEIYVHPGVGHNILLIQPRVKIGRSSEKKITSELKMDEAKALVKTLPNWEVIQSLVVSVQSLDGKFIFGKGNLERLKIILQSNRTITAVFVGIDIMTALQNTSLDQYLGVPVFDRYQVILQIFHDHAHTNEAKLQLALAEIPYLRVKLCGFFHTKFSSTFSGIHHVGGDGETFMEKRRHLLQVREIKLKKELEKIKKQRHFLRKSHRRSSLPVIAIVGYTNCGKTTLIKSLTNDASLLPEDKLFATLDVTLHAGMLPSNQKVLFIDTVGFISDVPTALIQSFKSTLEEVALADIVLHVRDISHPDTEAQKKVVLETLRDLELPPKLLESVIEVGNKVDLLESSSIIKEENMLLISATNGDGLLDLLHIIEGAILQTTGLSIVLLRIPNGGQEYSWLLKQATIRDAIADPKDSSYLIVESVISSANLAKFKHEFGNLTVKIESVKL